MRPHFVLRDTGRAPAGPRIEPALRPDLDAGLERAIVCAACGHTITAERERIRVDGSHDHRCVNPHGIRFHVGCFRSAPGCRSTGEPTFDYTWFAGFAWSYALCGSCATLLGWRYDGSGGTSFYGLILDRLAGGEKTH